MDCSCQEAFVHGCCGRVVAVVADRGAHLWCSGGTSAVVVAGRPCAGEEDLEPRQPPGCAATTEPGLLACPTKTGTKRHVSILFALAFQEQAYCDEARYRVSYLPSLTAAMAVIGRRQQSWWFWCAQGSWVHAGQLEIGSTGSMNIGDHPYGVIIPNKYREWTPSGRMNHGAVDVRGASGLRRKILAIMPGRGRRRRLQLLGWTKATNGRRGAEAPKMTMGRQRA